MSASGVYAFFDIDGTLVYRDERHLNGVPTARVRDALERFVAAGGRCVLCTGRPRGLVVPEVASLPFSGYVLMDGARVELGDRVVRDVAMPAELVRRALEEMERLDLSMIIESADLNVSLDRGENWFPHVTTVRSAREVEELRPDLRFSKIVFHNHELEKFLGSEFLRENFVLYQLGDGMNEVTVEGINKGTGLLALVDALDERPARTYAFGDSENDLPMLEAADVGVAMGNAQAHVIERVRELGGYVTDGVLQDGVATALKELREKVYEANMDLPRHGLVVFTWGNASELDPESGLFVIKPSGVDYDDLAPESMVVCDLDGKVVEGDLNPSSDTATHAALYRAWGERVRGVVHTHSAWAVSWAQAGRDVPAYGTTHADYFYGPVPCMRGLTEGEIGEAYEANTGRVIVEGFAGRGIDPVAVPAVLVRNHGPFSWGRDAAQAVYHAVVLEEVAKMATRTEALRPGVEPAPQYLQDKHYLRKHGPNAYYGQGGAH